MLLLQAMLVPHWSLSPGKMMDQHRLKHPIGSEFKLLPNFRHGARRLEGCMPLWWGVGLEAKVSGAVDVLFTFEQYKSEAYTYTSLHPPS